MMKNSRLVQILTDIIVIIIVAVICVLMHIFVTPNVKGFYCNDNDISHPYKQETVPAFAVAIFGVFGTILFILVIELINNFKENPDILETRYKQFLIIIYHGLSLFLLGTFITYLLTDIGKRWIGRLRPHFLDVCNPDLSNLNCTSPNDGEINSVYNYISTDGEFCRNDPSKVKEARLSFPSGHASLSCYTMLFLIIYIQARLVLFKFQYVKILLQLTAFIAAFVTSVSRISDYHHRGSDVLGGAILGIIVASFISFASGRIIWLKRDFREKHQINAKVASNNERSNNTGIENNTEF